MLSCSEEVTPVESCLSDKNESIYLSRSGDYSFNDIEIYQSAIERFREYLSIEEQKLIWNLTSAREINISEELFEEILTSHERINELIVQNRLKIKMNDNGFDLIPIEVFSTRRYNLDDLDKVQINSSNEQETLKKFLQIYSDYALGKKKGDLRNYVLIDQIEWNCNSSFGRTIRGYNRFLNGKMYDYAFFNQISTQIPDKNFYYITTVEYEPPTKFANGYYRLKNYKGDVILVIWIYNN
ncbi:MAG: hypothetical protein ACK5IJ_02425 [Mangrovibacterium sp.]